jgi:phospholipid-translocating ATPase
MFFVSIAMAKEGYEDLRRHRLDKVENNSEVEVVRRSSQRSEIKAEDKIDDHSSSVSVKWQDLKVGDVVKLKRDEPVPADIVLLHSSSANNLAYIETMALDGETNLKAKQPPAALSRAFDDEEGIVASVAEFVVEDPNLNLYSFEGRIVINGEAAPLTNTEVVYRGSVLRNTPSVLGMIIYSGEECKIRMNANKNPRIKAPLLQSVVNKIVVMMVCFVILLALGNSGAYQSWRSEHLSKSWYLDNARVPFGPLVTSFIIMFNTLIPLSVSTVTEGDVMLDTDEIRFATQLYISMEIIKVAQMGLLNVDVDMYDPVSNTPFEAKTSTINEELGQGEW